MKISRGTYYSVGALATAALMLESTLTRLLAVAQYYHFAFLVISLALLGFGASGSFLTIFPNWRSKQENGTDNAGRGKILILAGSGFAASLAVAYLVINWLPFDSYSIAWDRSQVLYFVLYYLVLTWDPAGFDRDAAGWSPRSAARLRIDRIICNPGLKGNVIIVDPDSGWTVIGGGNSRCDGLRIFQPAE